MMRRGKRRLGGRESQEKQNNAQENVGRKFFNMKIRHLHFFVLDLAPSSAELNGPTETISILYQLLFQFNHELQPF